MRLEISKAEFLLPLSRYASFAIAGLLLGAALSPLWWSVGEGAAETGTAPDCARWDDLARESIARLVQNGKHDADLRQVSDAIFRLRRARRNCDVGWTTLARQDYLAVSRIAVSSPPGQPGCTKANADTAHSLD